MLVIYFRDARPGDLCRAFEEESLADPDVREWLAATVNVRVPTDASIRVGGRPVVLLEHPAFAAMKGGPGVAVLDYTRPEAPTYARVVTAFAFAEGQRFSLGQLVVVEGPPAEVESATRPDAEPGTPPEVEPETQVKAEPDTPPEEEPEESDPSPAHEAETLVWGTDYGEAMKVAEREGRMMLICFHEPGASEVCERFASEVLGHPKVLGPLKDYVTVRLPLDATIVIGGKEEPILRQPAFREMLGRPGIAVVDFANQGTEHYGHVVSQFPFLGGRAYTVDQVSVMLSLPPGTLTQRTLIYAVRTHPDRPESTEGQFDPTLMREATAHSEHQARIRLQGHHNWERRFHRITALLPRGLLATEVCAESWPGESLLEAAIECVRSWRLSSGHWSAVRARHRVYGYDMRRGSNGVWYATGIFGRR